MLFCEMQGPLGSSPSPPSDARGSRLDRNYAVGREFLVSVVLRLINKCTAYGATNCAWCIDHRLDAFFVAYYISSLEM